MLPALHSILPFLTTESQSLATLSDGDNDNAMPNGRNGELDLVSALEPLTGLQVSSADVDNISLLPETCYSPRCTPERTCYAFSCPFKTSNDRLPFIVFEPEASFSMLPKTCYSPRCTPEQICYSFFCPNRAQQEQNQALTFSFMPTTCYSPKCTVGGVEVCYAFSCPNREKHQSFRSSSDSTAATSIPLDATRPRPRTPTRSWTPSYSVSTINGPQPEEEFVEDDEDSDVCFTFFSFFIPILTTHCRTK
ncbi:hypothetical protein DL96DRAFT_15508 [Flagelloscypha sp. PMI_526]|nr:hypothetical protein DL96DRAFT_15508 [Flagelloscypha sp. PMI_526]